MTNGCVLSVQESLIFFILQYHPSSPEKRPKPNTNDEEDIITLQILDNGKKLEFIDGIWTESSSKDKRQQHSSAAFNKAKDEEIRMITAKYDILLDLLTEMTLNNSATVRPRE